jgi:hypothetical protein
LAQELKDIAGLRFGKLLVGKEWGADMAEEFSKKRSDLLKRWSALKNERSSFMDEWQDISTYLLPTNGRFFTQDRNNGKRKRNSIYDSEATAALDILAAGMMSGATSPARPWFKLETHDTDLNKYQPVKLWLDDVTNRMLRVFAKSNTYDALHEMYLELGGFGTGASIVLPNYQNVIHLYPLTTGEYAIAADAEGRVCTLYREFDMTVHAMVKEFGLKNCSSAVQSAYNSGNLDDWHTVMHAIEPRVDRDIKKADSRNMAWSSIYFEAAGNTDKLLRESGFHQFPAVCPRWTKVGGDIYGRSPGSNALGDIKQLQHEQLRKAQGIDYQSNPPRLLPLSAKNEEVNLLPGGVSYIEMNTMASGAVRNAFEVPIKLDHLLVDIQDVRRRIRSRFYSDLFLMINEVEVGKMTATEVAVRQEEKMLMLGPVVQRLNHELLQPQIDITFTHMAAGGALPPPPKELQGMDLSVEFVSILSQAQKAIGTNSVDRLLNTIGAVAALNPEAVDKLDADQLIDGYSNMLGVDPKYIVPGEKVAVIRQARAKAQAAAQASALAQQQSQTAKNLAQSPTGDGSNGLQDLMNMYTGYN